MKYETKLFSELEANEFSSYISDKIWWKTVAYCTESFEN